MPRFASSHWLLGLAVPLILSCFLPKSAVAQTVVPDTAAADSVTEIESEETPGGRVKISIDESGISIEGRAKVSTPESPEGEDEWVEVYDERRKYREKGLDIVKFGESVFVAKDELVRGDLVVFGGNAIIEGRVGGNVVVIGGNIRARGGSVVKGDAVVIWGMLDEDDDVIIAGERVTVNDFFPASGSWIFSQEGRVIRAFLYPVGLFVRLILAFLVVLFLRDRIRTCEEHLASSYLKSFGVGLLSAFVAVFGLLALSILLLITIIGIPLAVLLWISCAGILIFAWTAFALSLGRLVSKQLQIQSDNPFLLVFIGAVVVNLPSVIAWGLGLGMSSFLAPLSITFSALGALLKAFAYLTGLGALILSRFGARPLTEVAGTMPPPPAPQTADAP